MEAMGTRPVVTPANNRDGIRENTWVFSRNSSGCLQFRLNALCVIYKTITRAMLKSRSDSAEPATRAAPDVAWSLHAPLQAAAAVT
jgi:hypothetical protein